MGVQQYSREGDRLQRALAILRTRASNHQPAVKRYQINLTRSPAFTVLDPM